MTDKLEALVDEKTFHEERLDFLSCLFSVSEVVKRSITDLANQFYSQSDLYLDLETSTELAALAVSAFEIYKLDSEIAKCIKKHDKAILKLEKRIQNCQ